MRLVGDIALDAEVRAIASGAITDGVPVVVNSTGTVSGVTAATAGAVGTAVVFNNNESIYIDSTFDSNSNRIVVAYRDSINGDNGYAVVGSVDSSDNSISFGTPVVYNSGSSSTSYNAIAFDSNSNKVVISYQDGGNSSYGTAIVGTVDPSDNSISFGSEAVFESASTRYITSTFDSNSNKVVIAYDDQGNSNYGTSVVATVSGTSVSFGTPVVFNSGGTLRPRITFDSSNNKVVIAYRDNGNSSHGTAIVGTVSGTAISFGSEVVFEAASTNYPAIAFDSNSNKVVITYQDQGNSNYGTAIVGTVSGTSISFGTAVVHRSANINEQSANFDTSKNVVVLAYTDTGSSGTANKIMISDGTVSGTSISFSSAIAGSSGQTRSTRGVSFDSNVNRTVISYTHEGNSDYATGIVYAAGTPTNITSENFIGFAHAAYADGQKATVKTTGSIARNIPQVPSSAAVGTKVEFVAADTSQSAPAVFDPDTNKVIIAFSDEGNSSYGTVVVATIDSSDNSVTYGSKVVFNSAQTSSSVMVYDTNSDRIVIGYTTNFTSLTGTSIVGTVSGSSVSFGSAVGFSGKTSKLAATFDSNSNKVVFGYEDHANSEHGTAIVGTVDPSDNSISFGSEAVYKAAQTSNVGMCFDTNSNKVVIAYRHDADSNKGEAIVGTVSGTSISYGSATVFNATNTQQFDSSVVFDSSNNKVVIIYSDSGGSSATEAQVGTVSGTSISFGTLATVPDSNGGIQAATFDSDNNNIILAYQDDGEHGNVVIGTVSGTDISFNTPIEFESGDYATPKAVAYDTNTKRALIAFQDTAASGHGQGIVLSPAGDVDLTPAQTYFVQTDGTLSETADSPSVTAGTAVAGSTLIVKG